MYSDISSVVLIELKLPMHVFYTKHESAVYLTLPKKRLKVAGIIWYENSIIIRIDENNQHNESNSETLQVFQENKMLQ